MLSGHRWAAGELRLCLAAEPGTLRGLPDGLPAEGEHRRRLRVQCLHLPLPCAVAELQWRRALERWRGRGRLRDPGGQRRRELRGLRTTLPGQLASVLARPGRRSAQLRRGELSIRVRGSALPRLHRWNVPGLYHRSGRRWLRDRLLQSAELRWTGKDLPHHRQRGSDLHLEREHRALRVWAAVPVRIRSRPVRGASGLQAAR